MDNKEISSPVATADFNNGPIVSPDSKKDDHVSKRLSVLEDQGHKRGKRFSRLGMALSLFFFVLASVMLYLTFYRFDLIVKYAKFAPGQSSPEQINENLGIDIKWKQCGAHSDCVQSRQSCCDCINGGGQRAINKEYLDEWQSLLKDSCSAVDCSGDNACVEGAAYCLNGFCRFIKKDDSVFGAEDIIGENGEELLSDGSATSSQWGNFKNESYSLSFPGDFKQMTSSQEGVTVFNSVEQRGQILIKVMPNKKGLDAEGLQSDFYKNNTSGIKYEDSFGEINGLKYYKQAQYGFGVFERYFIPLDGIIYNPGFTFRFSKEGSYSTSTDYFTLERELIDKIMAEFVPIGSQDSSADNQDSSADNINPNDKKRLEDIDAIRTGLELYFKENGGYPRELRSNGILAMPEGNDLSLPVDPVTGTPYSYRSYQNNAYALLFELETDTPFYPKGIVVATPAQLATGADSDRDGLYDSEEEIYGTDPSLADTDGDGFDDLSELQKGYNPIGQGKIY